MAGQSQKKLEHILEKSEELFWKFGYNAVSMDQIAAESGVSKMTVYKHFPSKEDLFLKTLRNSVEYHMNRVMEEIGQKLHTLEKIECMYEYSISLSKEFSPILIKDIIERPKLVERITVFKQEKALPMWRYILEDGMNKKDIRKLDVDFVSSLLMNLPKAFINFDFLNDEQKKFKFYENFFDFIKYGLLGGTERQES